MSQPQDLYDHAAAAYITQHIRHLPIGVLDFFLLAQTLAVISRQHDENIANGDPHYQIHLVWVALAHTAGLRVDFDGKIVDGPRLPDQGVQP